MTSETIRESPAANEPLLVLIPVYNDWVALDRLLSGLDDALAEAGLEAGVLAVDDGSPIPPAEVPEGRSFRALRHVDVLALRRNLGHQRALAISMAFVEDRGRCEAVVVMDSDGEDDPRDVPRLLTKYREEGGTRIVFAERTRRSESLLFRVFYAIYKVVHLALTGQAVRVGNFSVIPRRRLASLVVVSDLWNHYAAAAFRSRQPYCTIPTRRAKRLHGKSTMNFVGLVIHGLSAISVFSEVVGVRLLVLTMGVVPLTLAGIAAILYIRFFTDRAIPGWATYGVGILTILLCQALMFIVIYSFIILSGRQSSAFLPRRDYSYFIGGVRPLYGRASQ